MMATKLRKPLFERLKASLEEGIAHAKGELALKAVQLPDAPPEIDARTLVALREAAGMSQAVFAKVFYVSPKTVQSWEQGVRVPSRTVRRLIQIFIQHPGPVCGVIGLPEIQLEGFTTRAGSNGKRCIVQATGSSS